MEGKKILLAEDDGDDQLFFHNFLCDRSDIVLLCVVANGEEVIEYLAKNKINPAALPDVIILDQNMPRRNGLQTLAYLKASDELAHIPVMIYSTYIDDMLLKKSLNMGAAIVFTKPADKKGYNKMIDDLLATMEKPLPETPHR